jgi:hypothetical protein
MRALVALIFVGACSATNASIVVRGTTVTYEGSPSTGCLPTRVAEGVQRYLDAFNRGDQEALNALFQRSVLFTAQNPPPVGFFRSGGQEQLLEYFAQRHRQHETLELTALHIQYMPSGEAGLAPKMNQRSDDLTARVITAKGTFDCADGAIIAWNQGGP